MTIYPRMVEIIPSPGRWPVRMMEIAPDPETGKRKFVNTDGDIFDSSDIYHIEIVEELWENLPQVTRGATGGLCVPDVQSPYYSSSSEINHREAWKLLTLARRYEALARFLETEERAKQAAERKRQSLLEQANIELATITGTLSDGANGAHIRDAITAGARLVWPKTSGDEA